jgi:phosphoribosylformylglycinamidine cyclo-ligase
MSETYKKAGVDIEAAKKAVEMMKSHVISTYSKNVLSGMSSFGGMCDVSFLKGYDRPVLVQSTDGVGTKVNVAEMMGSYTIGQDIVNHCVNDILAHGARPLTFLDYIASDKLLPEVTAEIVANMAIACRENSLSLIAGEIAEMPSVYHRGRHDVAGFITGVVEFDKIINGSKIADGDVMIGLLSNGLHTNGFSLVRKVFFEIAKYNINTYLEGPGGLTIGEELLRVHRSYLKPVLQLLQGSNVDIHGIAHITGGGFYDNIGRLIKKGLCAKISLKWNVPFIFQAIQRIGNVPDEEMRKVFNLGVGMVLIVPPEKVGTVQFRLMECGEPETYVLGKITKTRTDKRVSFTY